MGRVQGGARSAPPALTWEGTAAQQDAGSNMNQCEFAGLWWRAPVNASMSPAPARPPDGEVLARNRAVVLPIGSLTAIKKIAGSEDTESLETRQPRSATPS